MKNNKRVVYRSVQKVINRDEYGIKSEDFLKRETIPSTYVKYGKEGPEQVQYSITKSPDKTTRQLVPDFFEIEMINGHIELFEGKDSSLIKFLDNHPNLDTKANREDGRKILFERVNPFQESKKSILSDDALVEAFNLIANSSVEELVEYAKVFRINTEAIEEQLNGPKSDRKKVSASEDYQIMIVDLKRMAKLDPLAFVKGLGDPLRSSKACISDAEKFDVIAFDPGQHAYGYKMGNDFSPIQIVPKGVDQNQWFAQWLTQNKETAQEINSRTELAKQVVKTAD